MLSYSYNIKGETNVMEKKSNHFSGQLGFVLAAAGSAVGVGNLWRFPYLAAKDGGGLFLIIYLILVLTFGFALLTSDIAKVEIPGNPHLPGTSPDHDLLRCHRRMDYQICGGIHNRSGTGTGSCRR